MPQQIVRFTKSWIEALSPPDDPANPPTYIDEIFRPLRRAIGKRRKTFSVNCIRAGRRKNITLGHWGDITIDDARNRARTIYAQFREDGVVIDRKRDDATLRDALDLLYGLPEHQLSASMRYEYRNQAELYLADWLDIPLRSFTRRCCGSDTRTSRSSARCRARAGARSTSRRGRSRLTRRTGC